MNEGVFTGDFEADSVSIGRSAVRNLKAGTARMEQSAVQRLSAETLSASSSVIGMANATNVELSESTAGVVAGDYVRIEEGRVFLLLAPRVSGNVRAVLTLPAAFALGAGFFVARGIVQALGNRGKR